MFKRTLRLNLEKALKRSPIILLTGARQTGKSTLIKQMGQKEGYTYITFDDIRFLSAAQNDPIGFVEGLSGPTILDEVQRIPEIFLPLKKRVDENRVPGMFALTGSANPLLIPRLGDSLAGRMEIFMLYPLSQGEINGLPPEHFIDTVFSGNIPVPSDTVSRQNLYERIDVGGYPLVQGVDAEGRESWFTAYVMAILQRDIRDISQISGLTELPRLLQLIATRAGTLFNVAELSRTAGIATSTLHRYIALLETVFLVQFLQPWSTNLSKRLVKSPKVYVVDSGLLGFLLGTSALQQKFDTKILGPLLENFVVNELAKQITWNQTRVKMFHYRTATGVEVDIILEDAAGNIVGIEIKNSATALAQDFKGLKHLQEEVGKKFIRGIVLYTGSEYVPFGERLCALPVSALWLTKK